MLYGAVVVERGAGIVADRFIGNRTIDSPYSATRPPPLGLHGGGTEQQERQVTAVRVPDAYSGELLRDESSHADAGTLGPVAVSLGSQYGTLERLRLPGAAGPRWSAVLPWKRGSAPCVTGSEGNGRA